MDEDCFACSISLAQDGYGVGEIQYHYQIGFGDGGSLCSLASPPHDKIASDAIENLNEWYAGEGFGLPEKAYIIHAPTGDNGDGCEG